MNAFWTLGLFDLSWEMESVLILRSNLDLTV